jgi:hypothetical protein
MKSAVQLFLVAFLGMFMSHAAVIDNFGTPQDVVTDSVAGTVASMSTIGNRTIWTNMTGGIGSTSIEIGDGLYLGSAGSLASGQTGVYYDGIWDLSSSSGLTLDIIDLEQYAGGSIEFFITQGANTASYSMGVPSVGTLIAGFGAFAGISGVDLSAVDRIGFTFGQVNAQDIVVDNFGTQVVPEPGTYAMLAGGLLAFSLLRRRRC